MILGWSKQYEINCCFRRLKGLTILKIGIWKSYSEVSANQCKLVIVTKVEFVLHIFFFFFTRISMCYKRHVLNKYHQILNEAILRKGCCDILIHIWDITLIACIFFMSSPIQPTQGGWPHIEGSEREILCGGRRLWRRSLFQQSLLWGWEELDWPARGAESRAV